MQIGSQKNGGWQNCEMADYVYSVAIQVNSYQIIWRIKWFGGLTGGELTNIHCICYITCLKLFSIHFSCVLVVDVLLLIHDMLFVEFVCIFVRIMFVSEVLLLLFTFRCQ